MELKEVIEYSRKHGLTEIKGDDYAKGVSQMTLTDKAIDCIEVIENALDNGYTLCKVDEAVKKMKNKFTIPLNPVTKKNSQMPVFIGKKCPACHKGQRVMILPSEAYQKYEKECKKHMPKVKTIDKAVNVKALYYMKTKRRVDLTNLNEALHDVLVKYGVLADDNNLIVASTDGSRVLYDKENPRTEVEIEEV